MPGFWLSAPSSGGGGGGGAPADATYITVSADGTLSNEVLLGTAFSKGLFAAIPAAGNAGFHFFATDTFKLYRDNGVSWDLVAVGLNGSSLLNLAWLGTGSPSGSNFLRGDGTWATPSGGGTTIVVQEGDSDVVATLDHLDFGPGFDVTESPANEANIVLDLSEVASQVLDAAKWNVLSKVANYTAVAYDFIKVDASAGAFTITLPAAASNTGKPIAIIRTDNTPANAVLIDPNSTEQINGDSTSLSFITQNACIVIISDGSNWYIA